MPESLKAWFETDEEVKDVEWAKMIVRNIRYYGIPLVNQIDAELGMAYLLNQQDMSAVRNKFLDAMSILANGQPGTFKDSGAPLNGGSDMNLVPEMQNVRIVPLPIFEKARNIITNEVKSMGVIANVKAVDPTSAEDRANTVGHVRNKKFIEGLLSYVYTQQGDAPVKMEHYETRFGKKHTTGNVEDFYKLGLDADDPQDVAHFEEHFLKLPHEVAAQQCINTIAKENDIVNKMDFLVMDMLGKKACALKNFVSDKNGMITNEYVAPENILIYGGTGRYKTFQDSNGVSYLQTVTISQFLELIGEEFSFEEHWNELVMSIFFYNSIQITGIAPGSTNGNIRFTYGSSTSGGARSNSGNTYGLEDFMQFKVGIGYAEWRSQNAEQQKDYLDSLANLNTDSTGKVIPKKSTKKYPTKSRYEQPIYKCYYMPISTIDQVIFKFGKLDYQNIDGYNDTQCFGSFKMWKEAGLPLSLVCKERIDLINLCFYQFLYEVYSARPQGEDILYESLLSMLPNVIDDANTGGISNSIQKLTQMYVKSKNRVYGLTKVNGVDTHISPKEMMSGRAGGIPEGAMRYLEVIQQELQAIDQELGLSDVRKGNAGADSNRIPGEVTMTALAQSRKATSYIPDGITYVINASTEMWMFFIQDIITFGNRDTLAYNHLLSLVGQECLDSIGQMGTESLRRFGIYITSLDQAKEKQDLDALLSQAIQTKAITVAQLFLIRGIQDPKEQFITLAYLEQKNAKDAQKAAQQQAQAQQQHEQMLMQMQLQKEHIAGDYMLQGKKIDYDTAIAEKTITAQSGIDKAVIKIQGDVNNIVAQAMADLHTERAMNNPNAPASIPPPPAPNGMQQGLPTQPPPPQENNMNVPQQ